MNYILQSEKFSEHHNCSIYSTKVCMFVATALYPSAYFHQGEYMVTSKFNAGGNNVFDQHPIQREEEGRGE